MKFLLNTLGLLFLSGIAMAAVPGLMNYQGILTDSLGTPVIDGNHSAVFKIYGAPTGGILLWTESETISTSKGLFTTILGNINPLSETIFSATPRYLGVAVDGGSEFTPRTELVTAPWAFHAQKAESVEDNAVNSQAIANGSVALADLGQNGATNGKIMKWQSGQWIIANDSTGGGGVSSGIASTHSTLVKTLPCDSMIDIATVTLTTPADGYIFVVGRATFDFGGSTSAITSLFQIDETAGGLEVSGNFMRAGLGGYTNTLESEIPVYVDRVYQKPAGTYTFRLEGRGCSFDVNAHVKAYYQGITAVYIPTAMGTVSTIN